MPVIVIGADTDIGASVLDTLLEPDREVRAFVSDPDVANDLRDRGVKVALGDLSDPSHVGGACTNCFSAVFITAAASDGRTLAFAQSVEVVLGGWAEAAVDADVTRVIWVTDRDTVPPVAGQSAVVDVRSTPNVPSEVARIDDQP